MVESGLTKASILVGIIGTALGTIIAVANFVGPDDPATTPSITVGHNDSQPGSTDTGCGPIAPAEVTLSTDHAARGSRVTVYGKCFQSDERVVLRVHVTEVGSATADSAGNFTQTITVPASAPPAGFPTDISATEKQSVKTGTAPFETG